MKGVERVEIVIRPVNQGDFEPKILYNEQIN